jgi:FkbM family methyltransferase
MIWPFKTKPAPTPEHRTDYEAMLQAFYESLLRPGDVCVDAGAHTGRHAFPMAAKVAPRGHVHAFEPIPACQKAIREGCAQRPEGTVVTLYPMALADFDGASDFVLVKNLPEYSGLKERVYDQPVEKEHLTVAVKRLDDVLAGLAALRYVKIDAEGGDFGILKGARSLLAKFGPVVSFEFGMNSSVQYGTQPVQVWDFLAELGYRVFDIRGRELGREAFDESGRAQKVWDYVAATARDAAFAGRSLAAINARNP